MKLEVLESIRRGLVFAVLSILLTSTFAKASPFDPVKPEQVPSGDPYAIIQPPVEDTQVFAGKNIAILASHGVEEDEIVFPYEYLLARSATVDIVTPNWATDGIVVSRFLKPSLFARSTTTFEHALKNQYDLLILTGGAWNTQVVRSDIDALKMISTHWKSGLPVAAICTGTAILINAGIARGQKLTGSPVVATDLINAGARFVDKPAVFGDHLLTSRTPNDLPQFVDGIYQLLTKE